MKRSKGILWVNLVGILCMVANFIPEFCIVLGPYMSAVIFVIGMLLFRVDEL